MENIETLSVFPDVQDVDAKAVTRPFRNPATASRSDLCRFTRRMAGLSDGAEGVHDARAVKARPDLISRAPDENLRLVIGRAGGIGRHFLVKYQRPWGKTTVSKQVRMFAQAVAFANGLLPRPAVLAASEVEIAMERRNGNADLAPGSVWEIEQGTVRCAVVRRGFVSYGVRVFVDGRKVTETFPFNLPGAIGQARQLAASLQGWTRMT